MKKILAFLILSVITGASSETLTFDINDYTVSADFKTIAYKGKTFKTYKFYEFSAPVRYEERNFDGSFAEGVVINSKDYTLVQPNIGISYYQTNPGSSSPNPYKPIYVGARGQKRKTGFSVMEINPFFIRKDSLFFISSVNFDLVDYRTYDPWPLKDSKSYEKIDMAIITAEKFVDNFEKYRLFKAKQGVQTVIKTVEEIYSEYPGESRVIKIREYIKDKYAGNDLEYVLIGGGYDIVPVGELFPIINTTTSYVYNDVFYSCLDGDPDANGNGIYFESAEKPDYYPDVYTGRFPGNTESEIDTIINKTIKYYSSTRNFRTGFNSSVFLLGLDLNTNNPGEGRKYCNTVKRMFPAEFVTDTLYEGFSAGLSYQSIMDRFNSGYNFVYSQSHGDYHNIRQVSNNFRIWSDQINATQKISGLYFIDSCQPGSIDRDSFSRKAMISPSGGCVNYIGSAAEEFPGITNSMNAYFFNESLKGMTLGKSLADAMIVFGDIYANQYGQYMALSYALQGDPSNKLMLKEPSTLYIGSMGQFKRGSGSVSGTFTTAPSDTVFVTLTANNEIISKTLATGTGFTLNYDNLTSDSVYIHYYSSGVFLKTYGYKTNAADEIEFSVTGIVPADANSSGVIEDGESSALRFSFKTVSNAAAIDSLVAEIGGISHAGVSIASGKKTFKVPAAGNTVTGNYFTINFSSPDSAAADSSASADFFIKKKNGTVIFSEKVYLPVSVPHLELQSLNRTGNTLKPKFLNYSKGKINIAEIELLQQTKIHRENIEIYQKKISVILKNISGYAVVSDSISFAIDSTKTYRLKTVLNSGKVYYSPEFFFKTSSVQPLNLFGDHSIGNINLEWTHTAAAQKISYNVYTSADQSFTNKVQRNFELVNAKEFSFVHSGNDPVYAKISVADSTGFEFESSPSVRIAPIGLYKNAPYKISTFQAYNPVFLNGKLISNTLNSDVAGLNAGGTLVNGTGIIHQASLNGFSSSEPQGFAIGDITGNGNSEMVNFSYSMGDSVLVKLICLETGAIRAQRRIYGYVLETVPVLSDIDTDNRPEIFISVFNGNIGGTAAKGAYIYGLKYNSGRLDMLSGYPIYSNADSFCVHSPTVLDLDGNGSKELIVDVGKKILVYNAVTAAKITEFTLPKNSQTSLSFCDLDENGSIEIFALTDSYGTYGKLFSFNFNGTSLTERAATSGGLNLDMKTWNLYDISPPVSFADFNNDGVTEIVVLTASRLYLYNRDFTPYPNFPVSLDPRVVRNNSSAPAFTDLNGDGHLDILFYDANFRVWCYSGSSGALLNGFPIKIENINRFEMTAPAVADLDNDGDLEFAIGVRDGYLVIYDYPSPTSDRAVSDKFRGDLYNSGLYQPLIPSAPQGVSISAFGSQITLSWNSVHNAVRYTVYSCDSPYGTFVYEGQTTGTSLVIYPGTAAKRFYYIKAER
jgi:hypothetical protein